MRIGIKFTAVLFAALLAAPCAPVAATEKSGAKDKGIHRDRQTTWTFDADGSLPAGGEVFSGDWAVRAEPGAPSPPNALCQTAEVPFPALMLGREEYQNVTVSTRFKPISGRSDQAAGILFRIRDRNNYYIVRANALEDNVNLYKYVGGRRSLVKESYARVVSGKWQELRVEASGDRIRAYLDGRLVLDARDGAFETGEVGLWTKSDSRTCFDDVKVESR
jgi:3-keto-disaccharide hydrolase